MTEFEKVLEEFKNDPFEIDNLIYWRCGTDVKLFAKYFFPHYCDLPFNNFHEDTFESYVFGQRSRRKVNAAPRGYAKSTIEAFIKPIHDVCYKLEHFIVIASNTDGQSVQKLKDIKAEFLDNGELIAMFGQFFKSRNVGAKEFIAVNGDHKVLFMAVGSKKEIRGTRFGSHRPTKIIIDDFEHSTEIENEEIRDKYEDLFKDVFSKIGNKKTNIEMIGTVLHRKALLCKVLKNPAYRGKVYTAIESWATNKELWLKWKDIYTDLDRFSSDDERIDAAQKFFDDNKEAMLEGTKVLWPDHESYLELQQEIIEAGLRSFMKEKQNAPMSDDEKIFDPEKIRYYREVEGGIKLEHNGVYIPWAQLPDSFGTMDPATGQVRAKKGKKGDFTCILSGFRDTKRRLFVHHDYTRRVAPSVYIAKSFDLHKEFDYVKFGVETNLYRNLLIPNMKDEEKRRQKEQKELIKLPIYDIEQVENKEKRIYTLEPKVEHGWIYFNRALSQEFFDQLFEFPKGDHDDCPDALEMLWSLVHNRYKAGGITKRSNR